MKAAIIDYGMGNLISVKRAVEECGADAYIAQAPSDLTNASHVILPGVGAFGDGIAALDRLGWADTLHNRIERDSISLLGICLGMQLLASHGTEGGLTSGLGLIPGVVDKLKPSKHSERVPHVGWNELWIQQETPLFQDIAHKSDYYFVHSFHFQPEDSSTILATTPYCGQFVSVVGRGRVWGTQFHPEKSQKSGFQLIRNFLTL